MTLPRSILPASILLLIAAIAPRTQAETGYEGWLRYAPLAASARSQYDSLPLRICVVGKSSVLAAAANELVRGTSGMLNRTPKIEKRQPDQAAFVLGTLADLNRFGMALNAPAGLQGDGFWLTTAQVHGFAGVVITGLTERGVLYGTFSLLSRIARHQPVINLNYVESPFAPIRWINQWDNLDGSIERGYGGRSIFFENRQIKSDLSRVRDYARFLASLGVNGCVINNVNADPAVLSDDFLLKLARVADEFRPWGIQLGLSVNFASPRLIGGLESFDPLDAKVATWWKDKVDQIYRAIPDFGGFVLKADSEGQLGPSSYGRTPAEAANAVARALRPHGGYLFYRAFVYNHHLDWTNLKNDRAKAAYDIFHPLDGQFQDNVIIQIKNGPIDFQVREPVSSLLGGLRKTNEAIELQITQEYLGQRRHLVFLVPMWKEILDFDLRVDDYHTPVKEIVSGKIFHHSIGGFAGVANVGLDSDWLGNPMAMANLYGFGRLAWNPDLSAETIAREWTQLTFGNDPSVVRTINDMLLRSWRVYESYTGPLGVGTLTDILGSHYGPGIESAERNGWGQWIRADDQGVGMDRSIATGTGYIGQYPPAVQKIYESLANCPDELLLFFHHVPYTYVLRSGKTVIQHIYDSHYSGADEAEHYVADWESLRGRIDDQRYALILSKLEYQAGHAIVWRDAVTNWFQRISGIVDAAGRVGNYPDRIEAEAMQLQGYTPVQVTPWETASGGKAVECPASEKVCNAAFQFRGSAGAYDVDVQYFDQNNGVSTFNLYVQNRLIDQWRAEAQFPARQPNGASSVRRRISSVTLHPGDEVRVEGIPDGEERAPLDYVAVHPVAVHATSNGLSLGGRR